MIFLRKGGCGKTTNQENDQMELHQGRGGERLSGTGEGARQRQSDASERRRQEKDAREPSAHPPEPLSCVLLGYFEEGKVDEAGVREETY